MVRELSVQDLGIIDTCEVSFEAGLTVLTGETGAGKSLLVDALDLAMGGRADASLVRAGADRAIVNLSIDLSGNDRGRSACEAHGVELDQGTLIIHREVSAAGRSTVRLNGRLATIGALRSIGATLVDLHGQHAHQALLDVDRQIEFLDDWIGETAAEVRRTVSEGFSCLQELRRQLETVRTGQRDAAQRIDMLKFQIEEIESLRPVVGEMELLEAQLNRLQHSEALSQSTNEALQSLFEGERSAQELLSENIRRLEASAQLDPEVEPILVPIRNSLFSLEEAATDLRKYVAALDMDSGGLEAAAGRIDALRTLRRKYGDSEEGVLQHLADAEAELGGLVNADASEEALVQRVREAEGALSKSAAKLSKIRSEKASEFGRLVTDGARELAMPNAEFEVRMSEKEVDATGADAVEFFFTASLGEERRPLAKIASGGEISRLMLAVKVASAGRAGVPTLIFDELDTGLSGRAAALTAKKLKQLSSDCQVIVISHLPQIAGLADDHFLLTKDESDQRAVATLTRLGDDGRVREVARLLAGEEVGEKALANAREFLG
ncbi:MAG: DNA repair protein RecN [Armatimonadetes bacterium]|nr:DNA repair protein RecN [Armatimonadota bacterium]